MDIATLKDRLRGIVKPTAPPDTDGPAEAGPHICQGPASRLRCGVRL